MFLQILRYIPANVVPTVVAFASVYVFTRRMSPAEFGDYTFALSAALLLSITLFYAIATVTVRMVPEADKAGGRAGLLKTAYGLLGMILLALAATGAAAPLIGPVRHAVPTAFWLAFPLAGLRGIVANNQSINQLDGRVWMYSVVECMQSLLGFLLATALFLLLSPTAVNLMLGFTFSALCCLVIDTRMSRLVFARIRFEKATAREIVHLATPLTATFLAGGLLLYTDRFTLGILSTAQQLGLYAVAAALVERPLTTLCTTIMTALYPLALRVLGQQGDAEGRVQLGRNLLALVSVTLPASVGIALLAHPIASVMVGETFRAGTAALIPFLAMVMFCRTLATHGFDHAFYLSRRPHLMLAIYAPVALLNVALSAVGAWLYGVYGTLGSGMICAALLLILEWRAIKRVFPLAIKIADLSKIFCATAGMAVIVLLLRAAEGWDGLIERVLIGAASYAVLYIAFNTLGIRLHIARWVRVLPRGAQT